MKSGKRGLMLLVGAMGAAVIGLSLQAAVAINEVAWGGTVASATDEWMELYNTSDAPVDLTGWTLVFGERVVHLGVVDGATTEVRRTVIEAGGYFLLERTDDQTVADVEADIIYTGGLSNEGVDVVLLDSNGDVVDRLICPEGGWPAGSGGSDDFPYRSMERVDPNDPDGAWATNRGLVTVGTDALGNPIHGTPRSENEAAILAAAAPRVDLIAPAGQAAELSGVVVIRWIADDPDGASEQLRIRIDLSSDAGETWAPLVENLANAGSFAWDTSHHENGDQYGIRVVAVDLDGYTTQAVSEALRIANPG